MNKYERYINYIVNDIQPPYFKNMEEIYGLRSDEYKVALSKLYDQPVTVKSNYVYDSNGKEIYYETSDGYWSKYEHDNNGNTIYVENSYGYWDKYEYDSNGRQIYHEYSDITTHGSKWVKREFDSNGNLIYYENSDGYWYKKEYDSNGNVIYFEDGTGIIRDRRYE